MFRKKKDTMADMKEKLSRIKFINVDREAPKMRRDDSDLLRDIDDYEDSRKFSADSLGQYDTALDSHTCFHRDCCFAYNITGSLKNTAVLAECLPQSTCKKLAAIWNLDQNACNQLDAYLCKYLESQKQEENRIVDEYIKNVEKDMGIRSEVSEDLQVEPGSEEKKKEDSLKTAKKENQYWNFIQRVRSTKMTETKAPNMSKKAGKITKIIIGNFLNWYQSLGAEEGEGSFIDESTLNELFQVGFDMPAAKPVAIRIKEIPTVPLCLANYRNEPKHSTTYALRKFLKGDIKMENIPMKMFAFGRMLPKEKNMRYKPPRNFVKKTWVECSRVSKDLNTMKTIWVGLEKLRSTIAFANWLKNHPEITPPIYLEEKGLLKINYEEWNQMYKGFEMDVTVESGDTEQKGGRDKASLSKASSVPSSHSNSVKYMSSSDSFL